jgi:serine/threonine protein kinase
VSPNVVTGSGAMDERARVGDRLDGRYRLHRRIARTAVAEAFRAEDEILGRPVVIALPRSVLLTHRRFRRRFAARAERLSTLRHPVLAAFHEARPLSNPPYVVQEDVGDLTLASVLRDGNGAQDPEAVLAWLLPVAEALDHARSRGLPHPGPTPETVVFDGRGRPTLNDLGLAMVLPETGAAALARHPDLLPPEARDGAGRPSDRWALAALAVRCLTGAPLPLVGGDAAVSGATAKLPPKLAGVLRRSLSEDAARRHGTAVGLARAFAEACRPEPAPPPPPKPRPRKKPRPEPTPKATRKPARTRPAPPPTPPPVKRPRPRSTGRLVLPVVTAVLLLAVAALLGPGRPETGGSPPLVATRTPGPSADVPEPPVAEPIPPAPAPPPGPEPVPVPPEPEVEPPPAPPAEIEAGPVREEEPPPEPPEIEPAPEPEAPVAPPPDRDPPVLTLASPEAGALTASEKIEFRGRVEDASEVIVVLDGRALSPTADGTFAATVPLTEGRNAIDLEARDVHGNRGAHLRRFVVRDSRPPRLSVEGPATDTPMSCRSLDLLVRARDEHPGELLVDGRAVEWPGGTVPVTLREGANDVRVEAVDGAGNRGRPMVLRFVRDTTPPVLAVEAPESTRPVARREVEIRVSVRDDHPGRLWIGDRPLAWPGETVRVDLREGENVLRITASDAAGNPAEPLVLRLERDTTAPRIELDAGGEIVCTDSRFDLTGHASEPVVLRVAGVETSVSEAFRLPVPLRVGRNDLVVRARDRAGNESVARLRVHRPDPAAARAGWKASALRQRRYDEETLTRLETLLAREAWQLPRWPWNRRGMLVVDHAPSGLRFVVVPGGSLRAGAIEPFLVAATECTLDAWSRPSGNGRRSADRSRPVAGVSWRECREWCEKLGLRLPSQAEWEYAARAGEPGTYCYGSDPGWLARFAWFGEIGGPTPRAVATREPNAWGLYDVHGNVWEWCMASATAARIAGGGHRSPAWMCGFRSWRSAPSRGDLTGFRPVATLPRR